MLPVKLETTYAAWLTVSVLGCSFSSGTSVKLGEKSLPSIGKEYTPRLTLYWSDFNQLGFLSLPCFTRSLISDLVISVRPYVLYSKSTAFIWSVFNFIM